MKTDVKLIKEKNDGKWLGTSRKRLLSEKQQRTMWLLVMLTRDNKAHIRCALCSGASQVLPKPETLLGPRGEAQHYRRMLSSHSACGNLLWKKQQMQANTSAGNNLNAIVTAIRICTQPQSPLHSAQTTKKLFCPVFSW